MKRFLLLTLLASSLCAAQTPRTSLAPALSWPDRLPDPPREAISAGARSGDFLYEDVQAGEKKSVALAACYSLLLPGMGELYSGDYGSGKYFTIAEGLLWITLGAVDIQAHSMQTDARSFAVQNAGIVPANQDDNFFSNIGDYNNVYSYNTAELRARQYFSTYNPQSSNAWAWNLDANRTTYRDMRVASDEMYNNEKFVAGVIVLNHIVSAVNAVRVTLAHNKAIAAGEAIDIHASLIGTLSRPDGIMLSFTRNF
jgi:hypothetical protein